MGVFKIVLTWSFWKANSHLLQKNPEKMDVFFISIMRLLKRNIN